MSNTWIAAKNYWIGLLWVRAKITYELVTTKDLDKIIDNLLSKTSNFLPPMLLITSPSLTDSSINCFFEIFFSDLDFFFFPFGFICFSLLQLLQHRFLGNNLNKKLHHWTVTNHKSYCRANMNRSHRLHTCVCVYIYVHIHSNLVLRAFCLSNIGLRERSHLPISDKQDTLEMRLYIQQYIWILYLSL